MIASRKVRTLMALASVAAFSGVCTAQLSNPSVFAMSLHDTMSQLESVTRDSSFTFDSPINGNETGTFILLMNNEQGNGVAFDAMDPRGGYGNANRGRGLTGIDAGRFVEPKEDNLNVVPLPGAAIAGFALLTGVAGIRLIRKSR